MASGARGASTAWRTPFPSATSARTTRAAVGCEARCASTHSTAAAAANAASREDWSAAGAAGASSGAPSPYASSSEPASSEPSPSSATEPSFTDPSGRSSTGSPRGSPSSASARAAANASNAASKSSAYANASDAFPNASPNAFPNAKPPSSSATSSPAGASRGANGSPGTHHLTGSSATFRVGVGAHAAPTPGFAAHRVARTGCVGIEPGGFATRTASPGASVCAYAARGSPTTTRPPSAAGAARNVFRRLAPRKQCAATTRDAAAFPPARRATSAARPTARSHATSVGANTVSPAEGVWSSPSRSPAASAKAAVVRSSGVSTSAVASEGTHSYQPGVADRDPSTAAARIPSVFFPANNGWQNLKARV